MGNSILKFFYVNSDIGLRLRSAPDSSTKDNIIGVLDNKQEVECIEQKDKWFKIKCLDKEGWVSSDYLISKPDELKVSQSIDEVIFEKGKKNLAADATTKKARQIINDALGGGGQGWALQCTEYVQYKVKVKIGIMIRWTVTKGRNGGRWAETFKSIGMYKVLEEPKKFTDASFTNPAFNAPYGHVAFVEDVLPDGSIKISEANWPKDGIYNERVLDKKYQKAKMIKFIDFS